VLTRDALGAVNHELWIEDSVDYVYSDEEKIDERGRTFGVFEKPAWSPERLLCQNYCSHLSAIRRSILVEVGGFRSEFDGAQDYDVVLRVTERARTITHIPRVLYHWRTLEGSTASTLDAKPYAVRAGQRAVAAALSRRGIDGQVVDVGHGYHRVRRAVRGEPKVSVIIPTRATIGRLWGLDLPYIVNVVDSFRHGTYANVEVVVVYDSAVTEDTLDRIRHHSPFPVTLVEYDEPFNFSKKCNLGALHASGERLIFLNDDMEVISEDWIERLVSFLDDDTVGLVGPLLLLDNHLVQSAGHISAPPANFGFRLPPTSGGGGGRPLDLNREVTGITGACMAMRTQTFFDIGGFSLDFPLNYNDVDLCFKLLDAGLRIIWTPDARLFHFESKSRLTTVSEAESRLLGQLWGRMMKEDRYLRVRAAPELPLGSRGKIKQRIRTRRGSISAIVGAGEEWTAATEGQDLL